MTAKNDITGDAIKTKGVTTDQFRSNWDMIFGKQQENKPMEGTGGGITQQVEGDGLANAAE